MEKQVFISHSVQDAAMAELICSELEKLDIGCWIAPRDIPYGNDWAGEIVSAIEACSLFLFLLSSKSNESRQCPKEVNLADNAGKSILCVALENIEMIPALKYHLTSGQIMTIDSYDTATKIKKVIDVICEKLTYKTEKDFAKAVNVDDELEDKFEELFGADRVDNSSEDVRFEEFLKNKESAYYINRLITNNPEWTKKKGKITGFSEDLFDKYGDYQPTKNLPPHTHTLEGVHFSIVEESNTIVVVYRQFVSYNPLTLEKYYRAERLDSIQETTGEGKIKKTFFIDIIHKEDGLIFLSFVDGGKVIVNSGIYDAIKGSISMTLNPSYLLLEESINQVEEKEWICKPDSPFIVIDPESGEEVKREKCVNESGEEQTIMRLRPHKSYFSFAICSNKRNGKSSESLDPEEIGDFYLDGVNGFKQSTYNALVWYNKAKTSESYRKMADIFACDPVFADVEMEKKYRQLYELSQNANEE